VKGRWNLGGKTFGRKGGPGGFDCPLGEGVSWLRNISVNECQTGFFRNEDRHLVMKGGHREKVGQV